MSSGALASIGKTEAAYFTMINANGGMTCSNKVIQGRLQPVTGTISVLRSLDFGP